MGFNSSVLDEIRGRLPLSAVVGRSVIWDKRKSQPQKGSYWAICPWHSERTPSFHVDDRRGIYKCFGCGVSGDHFRFLMEKLGKTFPEAVTELAAEAGVTLPDDTPATRAAAAKRMTLIEANQVAAIWYQRQLERSPAAMAYTASRGLTTADLAKYRIGYAPEGNGLLRASLGPADAMCEAGLLGRGDDGHTYDRFRDRLMFPILDGQGRAVAFSGRAMGEAQPKYLNSPETPIFDKGAMLYNGTAAREAAWNGAQLVLVEGQTDVIAVGRVDAAGVAPLGTALTDQHIPALKRASADVVVCFDGDAAGRKAAYRSIDLLLPAASPAFTARFADLPDGHDPDSMARKNPTSLAKAIERAVPLADMLWRRETTGIGVSPEDRARLEGNLRTALKRIADPDTRRAYGLDFKDRLASWGRRPRVYRSNSYSQHSTSPAASRLVNGFHQVAGMSLREAILIGAIAAAPQTAIDLAEQLSADDRLSPSTLQLIGRLITALAEAPPEATQEVLAATGLAEIVDEAMLKANAAGVAMAVGTEDAAAQAVLSGAIRRSYH